MKKILFILLIAIVSNTYAQITNTLSKTEKIYGLSKFWQEVNYNFVYLNKIDKIKWENDYKNLIEEVQETENDYEYYKLLQKFCATLKDGHTNVFFPETIQNNLFNTYFGEYRLFLTNFENKAIVTNINLSKKNEIPIGTEIIKVNGIDTKNYLEQNVIPYISSSTDYILMDMAVSNMLKGPVGEKFEITFKLPNGNIKVLNLTHNETIEKEIYPKFEDLELFEFKWIDKEIVYIALNSFSSSKIDSLFIDKLPELRKAKKLIIDLRNNGGGNSNFAKEIFYHLTSDSLIYGSKWQSRLHNSAFKSWGGYVTEKDTFGNEWATKSYHAYRDELIYTNSYKPERNPISTPKITIPIAILIGHRTASSSEDFLILADNQKHIIRIGEPTFGSTGNPYHFSLPGGGAARVCAKKDTYPDGREFVGYGIQPDIYVKKSLEDYLNDKDPVLDRAIKYLKGKK